MIGHMILRKNIDGEDILSLKIVGGMTLPPSSRKGAIIDKVKRGSIAEQEGHLRVGKRHHEKFLFLFILHPPRPLSLIPMNNFFVL